MSVVQPAPADCLSVYKGCWSALLGDERYDRWQSLKNSLGIHFDAPFFDVLLQLGEQYIHVDDLDSNDDQTNSGCDIDTEELSHVDAVTMQTVAAAGSMHAGHILSCLLRERHLLCQHITALQRDNEQRYQDIINAASSLTEPQPIVVDDNDDAQIVQTDSEIALDDVVDVEENEHIVIDEECGDIAVVEENGDNAHVEISRGDAAVVEESSETAAIEEEPLVDSGQNAVDSIGVVPTQKEEDSRDSIENDAAVEVVMNNMTEQAVDAGREPAVDRECCGVSDGCVSEPKCLECSVRLHRVEHSSSPSLVAVKWEMHGPTDSSASRVDSPLDEAVACLLDSSTSSMCDSDASDLNYTPHSPSKAGGHVGRPRKRRRRGKEEVKPSPSALLPAHHPISKPTTLLLAAPSHNTNDTRVQECNSSSDKTGANQLVQPPPPASRPTTGNQLELEHTGIAVAQPVVAPLVPRGGSSLQVDVSNVLEFGYDYTYQNKKVACLVKSAPPQPASTPSPILDTNTTYHWSNKAVPSTNQMAATSPLMPSPTPPPAEPPRQERGQGTSRFNSEFERHISTQQVLQQQQIKTVVQVAHPEQNAKENHQRASGTRKSASKDKAERRHSNSDKRTNSTAATKRTATGNQRVSATLKIKKNPPANITKIKSRLKHQHQERMMMKKRTTGVVASASSLPLPKKASVANSVATSKHRDKKTSSSGSAVVVAPRQSKPLVSKKQVPGLSRSKAAAASPQRRSSSSCSNSSSSSGGSAQQQQQATDQGVGNLDKAQSLLQAGSVVGVLSKCARCGDNFIDDECLRKHMRETHLGAASSGGKKKRIRDGISGGGSTSSGSSGNSSSTNIFEHLNKLGGGSGGGGGKGAPHRSSPTA